MIYPYNEEKTRVWVDYEWLELFEIKEVMQQRSVLSPFLFKVVVGVGTKFAKRYFLCVMLYLDDLVLMGERIGGIIKFRKWMEALRSKDLRIHFENTKVLVGECIAIDGLPVNKVCLCRIIILRVKANSALCVKCAG